MGGVGGDVGKCVGVWGEVRKDVWGGCGRVYGVSGEVCRRVGKGCGEGNGGDVGKCIEVWGSNQGRRENFRAPGQKIRLGPLVSGAPKTHD